MRPAIDRLTTARCEFFGAAVLAALCVACAGGDGKKPPGADSALSEKPIVAETSTFVGKYCPVTGHWTKCIVLNRLSSAGLAVHAESLAVVHDPKLTLAGQRLAIARGEIVIFIYADSGSRSRDDSKLDQRAYLTANDRATQLHSWTLLRSDNLLVLMNVLNETNRERIANAILAGPPQPVKPAPGK